MIAEHLVNFTSPKPELLQRLLQQVTMYGDDSDSESTQSLWLEETPPRKGESTPPRCYEINLSRCKCLGEPEHYQLATNWPASQAFPPETMVTAPFSPNTSCTAISDQQRSSIGFPLSHPVRPGRGDVGGETHKHLSLASPSADTGLSLVGFSVSSRRASALGPNCVSLSGSSQTALS